MVMQSVKGNEFRTGPDGHEPTFELLLRAKNGDQDAWSSIDQRYRDALTRVAHGRVQGELRRRLDTEDLVQSTLAAAHRAIQGYDYQGPGSLQAWLKRILVNRVKQGLRHHMSDKRDARLHADSGALDDREDLSTMSPGDALLLAERRAILIDAIRDLPEIERHILVATQLERVPVKEVALELGMDATTVRRRRAKAIATLDKILD